VARRQTPEADPSTPAAGDVVAIDWLAPCRRIVALQRELFAEQTGIAARTVYDGIGEGGDRSLTIDRRCEDIVFAELERLGEEGYEFTAISEERGEVAFGDGGSGPTMADVELGYVYDFGAGEEYYARRGAGATLDGQPLRAEGPGFGLEVVGIEGAKPERTIPVLDQLSGKTYRMRSVGSIAISLCYVAGGRFDAMLTSRASRSVDAAAGQLIAREAGSALVFAGEGLDVSLDLAARYHVAAALNPDMLATVLQAQTAAEPPPGGEA
jgi:myo-inositol-1(or 4)-monophosphatase